MTLLELRNMSLKEPNISSTADKVENNSETGTVEEDKVLHFTQTNNYSFQYEVSV